MSDFNAPVPSLARARAVLASAPAVDEYGFTFQQNTQGIHGSHGVAHPASVPTRTVEEAAGVMSLAWMQQQRREAVAKAAPLRAKRDVFDARRKERRGAILTLLNHDRLARGEKEIPTTTAETIASGDDRYRQFLDAAEFDFATLAVLENEITDWTEQIRSRQAELYAYGAEARLG